MPNARLEHNASDIKTSVRGIASAMTSDTQRCCDVDHPQSPLANASNQRRYCRETGRS